MVYGQGPKRLEEEVQERGLRPIERPFMVKADQVSLFFKCIPLV